MERVLAVLGCSSGGFCKRNDYSKLRSLPDVAFEADLSAQLIHDFLRYGKAQATPASVSFKIGKRHSNLFWF